MEIKSIRSGKMLDRKLLNFLNIENDMYEEVVQDSREGFTLEFQENARDFIRNIIVNTECGNLHSED